MTRMVRRLLVTDDAIDVAVTVNHVVVQLVIPNPFKQPARPFLDRLIVVGDEINNPAFGSVINYADYLMADLIAIRLRPARDSVIGARVIIGFVFRRNLAAITPFFQITNCISEPDLFRLVWHEFLARRVSRVLPDNRD